MKTKTKTKTKTEDVVVKVQKHATHRQEEENRWAAEVQAAKKETQTLREEMAQVKEDARTQQEEDSRRAAVIRVVKAHEQASHMQYEESRWGAGVQAAKKEAQTLREEMAQVKEDACARTQQEEDIRRAALNRAIQ